MGLFDRLRGKTLINESLVKTPKNLPPGAQVLQIPTVLNLPQIGPTGGSHVVSDVVTSMWFSALQPIKPMAPTGQRVRGFEIQPGANIVWTPKTEVEGTGPGYAILREFANSWDLLRLVIETVKDRLTTPQWEFRLIEKKGEKKGDYKRRNAEDVRIEQLTKFFKAPDAEHCFADWLRPLLEDMLVIDAASIYLERDLKGRVANLRVIDGGTIGRMLTDQGFTPPPPQVAYQQVLYGLPAHDLTTDELVYAMRNPRTNRRYGFSPVEQMMVTIAIGLSRQKFTLNYYTDGNMPEALCFLPQDVPIQRIREVQEWFDSILAGDLAKRRRLTFLPGYGSGKDTKPNIIFPKEVLLKDSMDEWLWQVACYAMGTTPQAMLRMMNRATAQQSAESSEEEGLEPKKIWIANTLNVIIQQKMKFEDLEFAWKQAREVDIVKQATVDKIYISCGVHTINETKDALGEDRFTFPEADEPGILTQNGFVPLTAGIVNQPGAAGSGKGPAAQHLISNLEDHHAAQEEKQQTQGEVAHGRALELQGAKGPAKEEVAPKKPAPKPPSKLKGKAFELKAPSGNGHGHCEKHEKYADGCFVCALAELHRVEELYELIET
jgi:hypothetical protein